MDYNPKTDNCQDCQRVFGHCHLPFRHLNGYHCLWQLSEFIDYKYSKYEHAAGRHVRASKEEPKKEEKKEEKVEEVKTEPIKPKQAPKKEAEDNLEDNLFDLIDSMYEDKE